MIRLPANDHFLGLISQTASTQPLVTASSCDSRENSPAVRPKRCHDNNGAFNPTRKQRNDTKRGRAREKMCDRHHKASASVETVGLRLGFPLTLKLFFVASVFEQCLLL